MLLLVLTFNAYACLLPLEMSMPSTMDNGCSTTDEQPVYQFCDAFKTLGAQSPDRLTTPDHQMLCFEDTPLLTLLGILGSSSNRLSPHPTVGPPQDLLLKISVLRI